MTGVPIMLRLWDRSRLPRAHAELAVLSVALAAIRFLRSRRKP